MIIAGFPCIGKTTIAKKYKSVIDLSSTQFRYIVDKNQINEDLKGRETKVLTKNPNWPNNYIQELLRIKDDYEIIFIQPREEVLEELNNLRIDYAVAVPDDGLKQEYISRAKFRGNNDDFLAIFSDKYEEWRNRMFKYSKNIILMQSGEYIDHTLIRLNLLSQNNVITK